MKTRLGLFATLLLALLTLSGCDSMATVLSGEPQAADSVGSVDAPMAAAAFKFYDSWAKW
ncbi:MAG: hypothetical protein OXE95_10495 [Chloroflexi bacterium]|nr:hypothetical protein [Chloroflexota bacterium]MCY4247987.1 hypothetical protein [Chloroflexota bacterium]